MKSNKLPPGFFVWPELPDVESIISGEYNIDLPSAPKTVLDIGANVGLFSLWASRKWPEAKILAFEPWPENAEHFKQNHFGNQSITLRECAVVGNDDHTRLMFSGRDNHGECNFVSGGTGRCPVLCLPAHGIPSCEFVKIDTEGCEVEILRGLDLSLTKAIAIEAHSASDLESIKSFLTGVGFKVYSIHGNSVGLWTAKFVRNEIAVNRQKLFVAVPTRGDMRSEFADCLMHLSHNPPCDMEIKKRVGDSMVSRARNDLTAEFLKSDCTDLLFIDDDLIFSPEHVARILSHDVDVVAGFYPKKQEGPLKWVCNITTPMSKIQPDGLQPMLYMGTGFMRIRVEVFKEMAGRYKDVCEYEEDETGEIKWDLWPVGVCNRRLLSEDWYFCRRCFDMGVTVYGDTHLIICHQDGGTTYPLLTQRDEISNPISDAKQLLPGQPLPNQEKEIYAFPGEGRK